MKVLITGAAGFIGFHTVNQLLDVGYEVIGLDNINDYYSPYLKYSRLEENGINRNQIKWYKLTQSSSHKNYQFIRMNLEDKQQLFNLFQTEKFDYIINLAAQAGVRYSIENPDVYIQSNIIGFHNILEACRYYPVKQLIHASSSSVYGENSKIPFSETDMVDTPVSLYAATKKSNELEAHSYSKLYKIPVTCLRFFTVYGPWGRPDMAPMLFADAILKDEPIKIFNNGNMERDFTYVQDIVYGIFQILEKDFASNNCYRVFNIGKGSPVKLLEFIETLEKSLGKVSKKTFLPMQAGDVRQTWADCSALNELCGYSPKTEIGEGINHFTTWINEMVQEGNLNFTY